MRIDRFQQPVESVDELANLIGSPSELVIQKQLPELDTHMRAFVGTSPFALLGTYGRNGQCDVSPRGDRPCVAQVLDSQTLVLAERPGNRRADSLRNIIETGRVGLLFLVPGRGETLRINGRGCVFRDADVLSGLVVQGKQPVLGIAVEAQECYFQCAKALLRSKLWDGGGENADACLASFAQILIDETQIQGETVASLNRQIQESYAERLY